VPREKPANRPPNDPPMPRWSDFVDVLELNLLLKLLLAVLLGGFIGIERELSGKSAGFRTHILICLGSAMFTELSFSISLVVNSANEAAGVAFRSDPGRIAAQIVTGIGFLGGGAILRDAGSVKGLTTAATIWVVAAVGMAVGAGAYIAAVGATGLVLFVLFPLRRLEQYFERRRRAMLQAHGPESGGS
jgi:putative Mg2+ transporter-C (MgtC) family protein